MADGAFLFAKLETATADGRLCNCPILNGVASALLSASGATTAARGWRLSMTYPAAGRTFTGSRGR
jgi:hypothetical protein